MNTEIKREIKIYKEIIKHLSEHLKEGNYDDLDISQLKLLNGEVERLKGKLKGGGIGLIPANSIPKTDEIWKYSNPKQVQKLANGYVKGMIVYKSDKPNKKYMVWNGDKWVRFGQMSPPMEDFTKHKNDIRRERYLNRAINIKGDWENDVYSPNNLSIHLLW